MAHGIGDYLVPKQIIPHLIYGGWISQRYYVLVIHSIPIWMLNAEWGGMRRGGSVLY